MLKTRIIAFIGIVLSLLEKQLVAQTGAPSNVEGQIAAQHVRERCVNIERSVCVGPKNTPIGLESTPENLIGHWKFDDRYGVDSSLQHNDLNIAPKVCAATGGKGYSGLFDGDAAVKIAHIAAYEAPQLTIAFWLFLISEPGEQGAWKTLLEKGDSPQQLTPSIMLWPNDNRLHVRVSTDFDWNENIDSQGGIPSRRWTHIAVTLSNMMLQVYLNGVLDQQKIVKGQIQLNHGPFYLGNSPWHSGALFCMDDLRIYNKILTRGELAALAAQATLIPLDMAVLGCESCTYARAMASCAEGYHLCSFPEIYAGAYHVARVQGWFRLNSIFWVRIDGADDPSEDDENANTRQVQPAVLRQELYDPNVYKMAICCADRQTV